MVELQKPELPPYDGSDFGVGRAWVYVLDIVFSGVKF